MIRLKNLITETAAPNISAAIKAEKSAVRSSMEENELDEKDIDRILAYINVVAPIAQKHYGPEFQSVANNVPRPKAASVEQANQVRTAMQSWIRKTATDFAPYISTGDKLKLWTGFKIAPWSEINANVQRLAYTIEGIIDRVDSDSDASYWSKYFETALVNESFIREIVGILT
jgi:hypothetical protein